LSLRFTFGQLFFNVMFPLEDLFDFCHKNVWYRPSG
jgi:hypothetical protein